MLRSWMRDHGKFRLKPCAVLESTSVRQGVAVISGVLDSLTSPKFDNQSVSVSGTSTPNESLASLSDASLPDRFIATVSRDESVRKLRKLWADHPLANKMTVTNEGNVQAVQQADVVLLWYEMLRKS